MTYEYPKFSDIKARFAVQESTYLTLCNQKKNFDELNNPQRRNEWTLLKQGLALIEESPGYLTKDGEELPSDKLAELQSKAATGLIALLINQLSSSIWRGSSSRTHDLFSKIAGFSPENTPVLLQKLEMSKALERFMYGFVVNKEQKTFHVNALTKAFPEKEALGAYVTEFIEGFANVRSAVGKDLVDAAILASKPTAEQSGGYSFINRLWGTADANSTTPSEKEVKNSAPSPQ